MVSLLELQVRRLTHPRRYKNGTVTLNWTSSDPTADTYLFRVNLRNADQSVLGGDFALADSGTFNTIAIIVN